MNRNGWVRLPRSYVDDPYYTDLHTKAVYVHILLTAEFKPRFVGGISLKAGEVLTTVKKIAAQTGLTVSQTRTSLRHLQMTDKIAIASTNKNSVITLIDTGVEEQTPKEVDEQNGKEKKTNLAQNSQTNQHAVRKPSYCSKKIIKNNKEKINDDANGAPEFELIDGELSDEEAARIDANCAEMLTFVDQPEVIEMLQYVNTVKDDLRLTDCSEHLALCKITKKYSWKRVRDAIHAAIAHKTHNPINYICRFCENGG